MPIVGEKERGVKARTMAMVTRCLARAVMGEAKMYASMMGVKRPVRARVTHTWSMWCGWLDGQYRLFVFRAGLARSLTAQEDQVGHRSEEADDEDEHRAADLRRPPEGRQHDTLRVELRTEQTHDRTSLAWVRTSRSPNSPATKYKNMQIDWTNARTS